MLLRSIACAAVAFTTTIATHAMADAPRLAATLTPVPAPLIIVPAPPPRPDMLPDGEVSGGASDIRFAWLTAPTTRYGHGVIGDAIEAGGMSVETANGNVLDLRLGDESVFEDRVARIVRADGADAVLAVKSYIERGAAVALVGVVSGKLRIIGESPPIGRPSRWLNPVGVADFDGDGRDEIAAVLTPHIGGILALYSLSGGVLVEKHRAEGFSNHAIGTRELGWSAIFDANGDGVADLVVPDAARRALRIVSFAGGRFAELARVPLPADLASGFTITDSSGQRRITLTLGDGRTYALQFAR